MHSRVNKSHYGYYLIAPFFVGLIFFGLAPILYTFYLSMTSEGRIPGHPGRLTAAAIKSSVPKWNGAFLCLETGPWERFLLAVSSKKPIGG